ncbi:MAG: C40 family peptidase [Peptostreptococcaceae bacterium]|nr:C40 family peptidase [Peptostreptococcaceae bacterium]
MKKQKILAIFFAVQFAVPTAGHAQNMDRVFDDLNIFVEHYVAQETLPLGLDPAALPVNAMMTTATYSGKTDMSVVSLNAHAQLGKTYRYGAYGPEQFDCSGLIYHVFSLSGKKVPRTSQAQSEAGISVAKENLQVGDIVFFDTRHTGNLSNIRIDTEDTLSLFGTEQSPSNEFAPSKVTHSGIYVGEGKFIHASSGSVMKVVVENLDSKYFAQRYLFARRYE